MVTARVVLGVSVKELIENSAGTLARRKWELAE
jgi:hypothetical protein